MFYTQLPSNNVNFVNLHLMLNQTKRFKMYYAIISQASITKRKVIASQRQKMLKKISMYAKHL